MRGRLKVGTRPKTEGQDSDLQPNQLQPRARLFRPGLTAAGASGK